MSGKDLKRLRVIREYIEKRISRSEAAENILFMSLSNIQFMPMQTKSYSYGGSREAEIQVSIWFYIFNALIGLFISKLFTK